MQNKTKTIAVLIGLLVGFACKAQETSNPYLDTLVITTDTQQEIIFTFYRMGAKKEYLTEELWGSILGAMQSAVEASEDQKGISVRYTKAKIKEEEVAKIEVKELADNADVYIINSTGTKEIRADRIEFLVQVPNLTVSFFVNDLTELEALKTLKVEEVWSQINTVYEDQGKRRRYYGKATLNSGVLNVAKIDGNPAGMDALELSAGAGLGFYRDRFVPDLGIKIGFHFPNRNEKFTSSFGLIYTQQYFFNESTNQNFDLDLNGFLSAFYSFDLEDRNVFGLALGTLIHRQGGFYKGSTYKMSLYTGGDKKGFGFTPELIFTNGFKDVFPAIKVGLSF